MYDYLSEALVLARDGNGDMDSRVTFYTKKFGKVVGKATSARKVTSKLAAHLEPGVISTIRFAEKNNFQITDALRIRKTALTPVALYFLNRILPEWQPDEELWNHLVEEEFSWTKILALLGWDPREGECRNCKKAKKLVFHIRSQEFFCENCALSEKPDALIYIV